MLLVNKFNMKDETTFVLIEKDTYPLIHEAMMPAMYAILERHFGSNVEIASQASLRVNLQGRRQVARFPTSNTKKFLAGAMQSDGVQQKVPDTQQS